MIGSKSKALSKVQFLDDFGESELNEDIIDAAEEYLVSVLKWKDTSYKTFDEYIYYQYVKCSTTWLTKTTRPHIMHFRRLGLSYTE